jgi:spermidine synthase
MRFHSTAFLSMIARNSFIQRTSLSARYDSADSFHHPSERSALPTGHHWMLDLFDCGCSSLTLEQAEALGQPCVDACIDAGMTVLSNTFHQFAPTGVTGVVLLSESHLALHTWPEYGFVSFDVYVCNYTEENKSKGEHLVRRLLELFRPDSYLNNATERGQRKRVSTNYFMEALTPDFGYWIKASQRLAPKQTPFQTLEILHAPSFGNILRLDDAFQYSDRDECCYHEPLVHMAMAHHGEPCQILIIGGGDGGAARQALKWPQVKRVTHVELDQEVVSAARLYLNQASAGDFNSQCERPAHLDPRYHLSIANGFDYIETLALDIRLGRAAQCEVLLLDLTDEGGPSKPLYTRAFFENCRDVLGETGLMTLLLAAPWFQTERCHTLLSQLRSVFAQVVPFLATVPMSGGQWLMALCAGEGCDLNVSSQQLDARLRSLRGAPLKLIHGELMNAMKVLPNYLK